MIIEMRTYRLKPGSVAEVEKRFAEGLKERVKVSPLGAFFHTEVGPLNRIIHCWPYEDLAHRSKVRAEKIPGWPPKTSEFIEEMESKIIIAAPFSPKMEPRRLGGLYEIRTYTMQPGVAPTVIEKWAERIEGRLKFSPLAFCGHTPQAACSSSSRTCSSCRRSSPRCASRITPSTPWPGLTRGPSAHGLDPWASTSSSQVS
jgi:hypothetical protein